MSYNVITADEANDNSQLEYHDAEQTTFLQHIANINRIIELASKQQRNTASYELSMSKKFRGYQDDLDGLIFIFQEASFEVTSSIEETYDTDFIRLEFYW